MKVTDERILIANDGMYLTNGDTIGTTVILADGASAQEWREITA